MFELLVHFLRWNYTCGNYLLFEQPDTNDMAAPHVFSVCWRQYVQLHTILAPAVRPWTYKYSQSIVLEMTPNAQFYGT